MEYIYLLWTRENGGSWTIFGYTTDGLGAISWKEQAENGVHRRYERVNERSV
jgi:hypothetical protein|tara:strand:+ start:216 stop:371 length:156 start_codon:yes stop_codon:yes gene_type:complete